jgi:hypothetical protein
MEDLALKGTGKALGMTGSATSAHEYDELGALVPRELHGGAFTQRLISSPRT